LLAGICRRRLSFVVVCNTPRRSNVTHRGAARDGWPVVLRSVRGTPCYPHMPMGKVWIYRLLFVCVRLFACTVTDFSSEGKASGVKFCVVVYGRSRQGISHFGELCSPEAQKSDESARVCLFVCLLFRTQYLKIRCS